MRSVKKPSAMGKRKAAEDGGSNAVRGAHDKDEERGEGSGEEEDEASALLANGSSGGSSKEGAAAGRQQQRASSSGSSGGRREIDKVAKNFEKITQAQKALFKSKSVKNLLVVTEMHDGRIFACVSPGLKPWALAESGLEKVLSTQSTNTDPHRDKVLQAYASVDQCFGLLDRDDVRALARHLGYERVFSTMGEDTVPEHVQFMIGQHFCVGAHSQNQQNKGQRHTQTYKASEIFDLSCWKQGPVRDGTVAIKFEDLIKPIPVHRLSPPQAIAAIRITLEVLNPGQKSSCARSLCLRV